MNRAYRLGFYASLAMAFGLGCVVLSCLRDSASTMNVAERRLFTAAVVLIYVGALVKSVLIISEGRRTHIGSSRERNSGENGDHGPDSGSP